jgi:hypothetical protein
LETRGNVPPVRPPTFDERFNIGGGADDWNLQGTGKAPIEDPATGQVRPDGKATTPHAPTGGATPPVVGSGAGAAPKVVLGPPAPTALSTLTPVGSRPNIWSNVDFLIIAGTANGKEHMNEVDPHELIKLWTEEVPSVKADPNFAAQVMTEWNTLSAWVRPGRSESQTTMALMAARYGFGEGSWYKGATSSVVQPNLAPIAVSESYSPAALQQEQAQVARFRRFGDPNNLTPAEGGESIGPRFGPHPWDPYVAPKGNVPIVPKAQPTMGPQGPSDSTRTYVVPDPAGEFTTPITAPESDTAPEPGPTPGPAPSPEPMLVPREQSRPFDRGGLIRQPEPRPRTPPPEIDIPTIRVPKVNVPPDGYFNEQMPGGNTGGTYNNTRRTQAF